VRERVEEAEIEKLEWEINDQSPFQSEPPCNGARKYEEEKYGDIQSQIVLKYRAHGVVQRKEINRNKDTNERASKTIQGVH